MEPKAIVAASQGNPPISLCRSRSVDSWNKLINSCNHGLISIQKESVVCA
jgi:hypothetical protein